MPTYEFRCEQCDNRVEVFQSMSAPAPAACETCGAENTMVKVLFAPAVHYKGSGFYATDYAGNKPAASTDSKPSAESGSGGDSGSSSSSGTDGGSTSSTAAPSSGSSSPASSD